MREPTNLARPVVYFSALSCATGVAVVHEIFVRQPKVFLDPGHGVEAKLTWLLGGLGLVVGSVAFKRSELCARIRLTWSLIVLSLCSSISVPLLFFGFAESKLLSIGAIGIPALCALSLTTAAIAARQALGPAISGFAIFPWFLNPFRLLALLFCFGFAAAAAAVVGPWRSASATGMALGALASWCPPLFVYLDRMAFRGARSARLCAFAAFGIGLVSFVTSLAFLPATDHRTYEAEVVFAVQSTRQRYVVTSGQGSFELFVGNMLKVSSIDDHRYFECLIHPAFSLARQRAEVLVLGTGDGMAEREILTYPEVARITVVVLDARLSELSRQSAWLAERSARAMSSPKVRIIESEPIVWLESTAKSFDVIVVDLPDPTDNVEGKNYTRYFYELLARHLKTDGLAVVQATSAFKTPLTFASIGTTLRASGLHTLPYRAPVPSLGDWGFVLASARELKRPTSVPSGLRFLTNALLPTLFAMPADTRPTADAVLSTLDDQRIVGVFEEERRLLDER